MALSHSHSHSHLFYFIILLLIIQRSHSEPTQDKQALKSFLSQVPHAARLQWNDSDSVCNWVGIVCDSSRSHVYSLRLPAVGLVGPIPENTIGRLSQLRVLSIHSNSLTGSLPTDFSNLTFLRAIYIGNNHLSGEFPPSLTQLTRLNRLDLSSNNFSGPIPFSVNNLTQLTTLFLQNNNFSGELPSITPHLTQFNVSYNKLNGSIPKTLSTFPESSFAGNLQLCGGPLKPCSFFPSPSPAPSGVVPSTPAERTSNKKLSKGAIIGISIAGAALLLCFIVIILLCFIKRTKSRAQPTGAGAKAVAERGGVAAVGEAGTSSSKDDIVSGTGASIGDKNKLVFVNAGGGDGSGGGGGYSFDLEDLLRASAEVLGKGSVGTSYKAVLEEGTTVVVKRLKDVVAGKREFEAQMEVVGKCKHENVVPLRAYYYSKDEKLLVYDYLPNGSLSALLHGSRGSGRTALDWDNRLRIALGTARGLAYLHVTNNLVHANIKSSNILLQSNNEPAISDFGLSPIFAPNGPSSASRVAGYRAPEVVETRKPTFKSDVYSFGVLLLELLTGKSPNQASLGDEGIDLPRWVQSVVREEWTAEVFDVELMRYHNIEEEMVQLLQIAMACVSMVPDQRPSMPEALRMIEEMNRGGESATDDGIRQSSDDPSKGSDGQTPPVESRTPPSSVTP